jgi:hypothetical protein
MEERVLIGEHVAYRGFEVRGDRLWSIGYGEYQWSTGTNEARCDQVGKRRIFWTNDPMDTDALVERKVAAGAHGRIPSPSCECGFYAYRSEFLARMHLGFPIMRPGRSTLHGLGNFGTDAHETLAIVKLWGRTIQGTDGFRSQFASILALIVEDPEPFGGVLEAYDIPSVSPRDTVANGYVAAVDGIRLRLMSVSADLGWFTAEAKAARIGQEVTVEYDVLGEDRVITSIFVHREELEED